MDESSLFWGVMEVASSPILILTQNLEVGEINAEAQTLFDLERSDVVGRSIFEAWAKDGFGDLEQTDMEGLTPGKVLRGIEGRITDDLDGGYDRVIVWNLGLTEQRYYILIGQDITGYQQAQEALREREARMTSVIATAPDAIVTINDTGIIQSFSLAAQVMFGYAAGEVVGRNISSLMPSPHRENHDGYLMRYLATSERHIIGIGRQIEAQHKDGTIFPIELAVGEAYVGKTRIFTGFIRDLSARVRMEEELRQAQKMEAIGQLTGGVAHDFNNILTVISGNLEYLERKLTTDEQREIVAEAQEAAQMGASLSHRLLAFGRRQPLSPKPINLSHLVRGMIDLLKRTLGSSILIQSELVDDLPLTTADPGQIENALLNLAINSRDAMPMGGTLSLSTETVVVDEGFSDQHPPLQSGDYVVLSVKDTGIGMSKVVRERAFEPFFTTKGPGQGTGLGLSSVYGLVKQSGGNIQLISEEGEGTCVKIYMPLSKTAQAPQAPERTVLSAPSHGACVLVVEDDTRVRKVSMRRIAEMGYRVIDADNGQSALDIVMSDPSVDIVFTDVMMPGGMSGIDLAAQVSAYDSRIKILLTSGYTDPEALGSDQALSRYPLIRKPYSSTDLARKLRELVD